MEDEPVRQASPQLDDHDPDVPAAEADAQVARLEEEVLRQPLPQLDAEAAEAAERVERSSFHPFPSQADADMAALYVAKFGLGVGTLDAILEIAMRGDLHSPTTNKLMSIVDQLPGMAYVYHELLIPGYSKVPYRLFYRNVTEGVDFLLRQHGRDLILPVLYPAPAVGVEETRKIEEAWQARRYQALLREFRSSGAREIGRAHV